MLRVRRRRRDRGIAPSRVEPLLGDRGIVVEMDQIMRDSGVPRLALEDRFEDCGTLKLVGIALVVGRRRDIESNRIRDLGFVIVWIALRQRFHRLQIFLHALGVGQLVVIGIKNEESVDVLAFAWCFRAERSCFFQDGDSTQDTD